MIKYIITILLLLYQHPLYAATIVADTCSQADVTTAISAASAGDTVTIPSGTCTWGASGTSLSVNKAITLQGAGQGSTIINISDTAGDWGACVIGISAAATVKSFTINGAAVAASHDCAISTSTSDGWRITDIDYNGGIGSAYFVYVNQVYGLIDNNDITGAYGSTESIFVRGKTDSWQTDNSIGGANNVFIEDNTFGGSLYVIDNNANGRAVIRYNTITGPNKIDAHGAATNTPRGVRHTEIYNNTWTLDADYWTVIDFRGGGGRIFDNTVVENNDVWIELKDELAMGLSGYPPCECPADVPIVDQIGVGKDPKVGGAEPLYMWNNKTAANYWTITWKSTADCTTACGGAFSMADIIRVNTDYFISNSKPEAMSEYTPYTYPHPLQGEADTTAPTITAFTMPSTASSTVVVATEFTATDSTGVTGYCITTVNSSAGCSWSASAPVTATGAAGEITWYAWAKDAADNISTASTDTTTITLPANSNSFSGAVNFH